MAYLTDQTSYENLIKRGVLSVRSKRLDTLVNAIKTYVSQKNGDNLAAVEKALDDWKTQDPKEFSDRGKASEAALRAEIKSEGVPYWGLGKIRLVDPSSHPPYEPWKWNVNQSVQFSTNCYAYACNDAYLHQFKTKPQPGELGGRPVDAMKGAEVRLAVLHDDMQRNAMQLQRLVPLIRLRGEAVPDEVVNVPGYYLIALVTALHADYHWLRQDNDGMWSHKPGWSKAINVDASGAPIDDPRTCNLKYGYVKGVGMMNYKFTTFYYAPKGGVRTGPLGMVTSTQRRGSI